MILKWIKKMCSSAQEKIFGSYERCYTEQEYSGHAAMGLCSGLVGGTKNTEYLSESCIDCPHLCVATKPPAVIYIDDSD